MTGRHCPNSSLRASARSATPRLVSAVPREPRDCGDDVRRGCPVPGTRAKARSATPRLTGGVPCDSRASSGSRRRSSSNRSESPGVPAASQGEEHEHCGSCSIEAFWAAYDVFHAMDRRAVDAVQRVDFIWALGALGTGRNFKVFQRILRKAGLSEYFRNTARSLYLEDFIHRVFPSLAPEELLCMWRWVNLRKAWHFVHQSHFRASKDDMQRIFSLLCAVGESQLPISALYRARIFTELEVRGVMRSNRLELSYLTCEEFLQYFHVELAKKFTKPEPEKEADWLAGARSRFQQTRVSVDMTDCTPAIPMRSAWAETEEASSARGEVPNASSQERPHGLPRLPRHPRGCKKNAVNAVVAGCRLQRAAAAHASSRSVSS